MINTLNTQLDIPPTIKLYYCNLQAKPSKSFRQFIEGHK